MGSESLVQVHILLLVYTEIYIRQQGSNSQGLELLQCNLNFCIFVLL